MQHTQVDQSELVVSNFPTISDPNDSSFKIELNLGLALPFQHYIDDSRKAEPRRSIVKTVDADQNIFMLEIKSQSDKGPLQAMENDVLVSLLSMAIEQKNKNIQESEGKFRVYYSLASICTRLGISVGSSGRVALALENIKSQNITFKNFGYFSKTSEFVEGEFNTRIILSSGRVRVGKTNTNENSKELFYADFEPKIIKNLFNDYYSVIEHKRYLELSPGNQRRIIVYLYSKKKQFGPEFMFDLDELAEVLGISDSPKRRYIIGDHLTKIKATYNEIDYSISKLKGQPKYEVIIRFNMENLIVDNRDPFWKDIIADFGEEELNSRDILMHDITTTRDELTRKYKNLTGSEEFIFNGKSINAGEMALDICLFQVIRTGYHLTKGFKALANKILESLALTTYELPEKYRSFVADRVKEKEKSETEKRARLAHDKKMVAIQLEEENFDKTFAKIYQEVITAKPKFKAQLEADARAILLAEGIDEQFMLFVAELHNRMYNMAKMKMKSGDWNDLLVKSKRVDNFVLS